MLAREKPFGFWLFVGFNCLVIAISMLAVAFLNSCSMAEPSSPIGDITFNYGSSNNTDSISENTTTNLDGILIGDGMNVNAITRPSGDVVGTTESQIITDKTFNGSFVYTDGSLIVGSEINGESFFINGWRNDHEHYENLMEVKNSIPPFLSFSSGAIEIYSNNYLRFQVPFEMVEISSTGTPSSNRGRVYAIEGTGDGLTDICAKFQDGSVDVFAQETTELDSPIFGYDSGTTGNVILTKPHPGLIKFEMVFPDGSTFVLREIEFHDKEHIEANKGCLNPLPEDWEITTAEERALIPDVPTWEDWK